MRPYSAPRPGGFPSIFFQTSWDIISDSVSAAVMSCFISMSILVEINMTNITLVPKVKDPTMLLKFRPISLCNIIYKIFSKLIANRLMYVLHDIISPNQYVIIPSRAITDNKVIAYEALHSMRTVKSRRNKIYFSFKADFSKAFDRMDWDFIMNMLIWMGFHSA